MITQEQIKATIERAEKQKQELQELINSLSTGEVKQDGRARHGELYGYIDDIGQICSKIESGSFHDEYRYEIGNYYLTPEDANRAEVQIRLFRLLDRFSRQNGWTDELWKDDEKCKYYIFFDYVYNKIGIGDRYCVADPTVAYFASESVAQQAIDRYRDLIMEATPI